MTPTLTAEEAAISLREAADGCSEVLWYADKLHAAADLLLAQSALLAEARACLEPFAHRWIEVRALSHFSVMEVAPDEVTATVEAGHLRVAAALHEKLGKMG